MTNRPVAFVGMRFYNATAETLLIDGKLVAEGARAKNVALQKSGLWSKTVANAFANITPAQLSVHDTPETRQAVRYSELDADDVCDYGKPEAFVSKCWRHPDSCCMCPVDN